MRNIGDRRFHPNGAAALAVSIARAGKSFPQALLLGNREVVLTFDDGPSAATSPQTLDHLKSARGIVVFGADLIADHRVPMTQEAQLKLLTDRLKAGGKQSFCCTIPRRKQPLFRRLSCAICVTTAIR